MTSTTSVTPPAPPAATAVDLVKAPMAQVISDLGASTTQGLSASEAQSRLGKYGPNAVVTKKKSKLSEVLGYFTGPIAYMIEAAAIISAVLGHWPDFIIITALLLINAALGYWQDRKAANALSALQKGLAPTANVLRDGHWSTVPAAQLVPGDVVRVRLGDVVPADIRVFGTGEAQVDQAALTGESRLITKAEGAEAYSGSIVREGEATGLVIATGANTYLGRTTKLVASAHAVSHAQQAMFRIGDFLIALAVFLAVILVVVQVWRDVAGNSWKWDDALSILQFVLVLLVASIPVAMPAVFSVTMAVGAVQLSKEKAIVSRLESIEELSGVDILCSDKTGTLTENTLSVVKTIPVADSDSQDILIAAALASQAGDHDPVDDACEAAVADHALLTQYTVNKFVPFDPVVKRSSAEVTDPHGQAQVVAKGSVGSIIELVKADAALAAQVNQIDQQLAAEGNKSLGVARSTDGGATWQVLGVLALFDPPFPSAAETIALVKGEGVQIKMVTGDDTDIAIETAKQLGLGTNILAAPEIFPADMNPNAVPDEIQDVIVRADGFARVFPQHKYAIVKVLQQRGNIVAMTGDGVNDAPALKQADCGIAVSDAVAAARAAAALVLTVPGLQVINTAIQAARKIFQRITAYTIYRIALTINIMFLVVIGSIWFDYAPLTALMIVVISLLDDVPIMTIAYDNAYVSKTPLRWQMGRVITTASALGFFAVVQSLIVLIVANEALKQQWMGITDHGMVESIIFLQLVIGGHMLVLVARARTWFFLKPFPAWQLLGTLVAMATIGTLMAGMGWFVPKVPWAVVGIIIGYNFVWMILQNIVKIAADKIASHESPRRSKHAELMSRDLAAARVDWDHAFDHKALPAAQSAEQAAAAALAGAGQSATNPGAAQPVAAAASPAAPPPASPSSPSST